MSIPHLTTFRMPFRHHLDPFWASVDHFWTPFWTTLDPILDPSFFNSRIRARGYEGLIIGLTSITDTEDVEHFVTRGANHVLPKPFDIDSFHAAVRDFIVNKQMKERQEQEQEQALKSKSPSRRHKAGRGVDGLRVLVVDDSKATR